MIFLENGLVGVNGKFICIINLHEEAFNYSRGVPCLFCLDLVIFNLLSSNLIIFGYKGVENVDEHVI